MPSLLTDLDLCPVCGDADAGGPRRLLGALELLLQATHRLLLRLATDVATARVLRMGESTAVMVGYCVKSNYWDTFVIPKECHNIGFSLYLINVIHVDSKP